MRGFSHLKNVATLELDRAACIGCGRCPEVCPHGVFWLDGGKAALADRDLCMECGACARNCPVAAIRVDAGVGCASGMITEWLRERNIRWSGADGC
ncbi:mercury methylation ferredoxin HgcB [Geobacter pickeringii]|uniref:Ferredoxin n=1 Tax=Geobacter pickeringii TaxID=345632 RepID=A0A0B5BE19_9BACT|nr:mercury methylation ferredoxin HgcB [Geobacter pickeringii]AJE02780.1 ferredoxin [Geobacter pickeringii]